MKRGLIILALVVIVALPFVFRPERESVAQSDETLAIVTPHNEAIRSEFGRGFAEWYKAQTGRTVSIDWRVIGGTSEIARFLEGEYVSAFENLWRQRMGKPWSAEIQAGFQNPRLPADAPAIVREAREVFLASEVSCGIDLFFGGGTFDFERQAQAGRLVDSGVMKAHPDWFNEAVIPRRAGGEDYWRSDGLWIGAVLSSYGIIFNRDSLAQLGIEREPRQWSDLADPRLVGAVGLADPTKSGSVAKAFENIIQQQMQRRLGELGAAGVTGAALESRAVTEGWMEGLKLLQRIGANSRYFTDSSQKPPIDVAAGNCAVGLCIDFYGRQQQEAVRRRSPATGGAERVGYVSPAGGSVASVDPIALLRGARNRAVAVSFIEYVLSPDGQKLWNFKVGTPGGPERFALRRLPVRRDFYAQKEWREHMSDPEESPYDVREPLIYREAWTGRIFREMAFAIRVMCQDTHGELVPAWRAIHAAPEPAKSQALEALQDLALLSYERMNGDIKRALGSKDKVDEVRMAKALADALRANYRKAEAIAKGGS
jgi:ABC-type Fe3+ transport system substrate-binding protein